MDAVLPPTLSNFSKTVTLIPFLASREPMPRPPIPAPMIHTLVLLDDTQK
jgi:hypothetical protein